ncbi:hypothetical protein L2E82_01749 [Cichorium intybus]|uniref:Uncharacterized protein n=1 Tax=Cichorium intybus TaxID=13427 RepID=A0ACB9H113_CICIN|nr:hypothetical protein L2E82_01749 [Cichorium intybus]
MGCAVNRVTFDGCLNPSTHLIKKKKRIGKIAAQGNLLSLCKQSGLLSVLVVFYELLAIIFLSSDEVSRKSYGILSLKCAISSISTK